MRKAEELLGLSDDELSLVPPEEISEALFEASTRGVPPGDPWLDREREGIEFRLLGWSIAMDRTRALVKVLVRAHPELEGAFREALAEVSRGLREAVRLAVEGPPQEGEG